METAGLYSETAGLHVFPLLRRLTAGEQRTAAAFPILGDILEDHRISGQKPKPK